ncbi:MAG: hypothetical protein AAF466_00055 [Bacteroidota bacterium]
MTVLLAVIAFSFTTETNVSPTIEVSELETKVVCLNGEEVVVYNLGEEMVNFNIDIEWIGEARFPGFGNIEQIRTNTRTYYQTTWGMGPFIHVIDDNHERWAFTTAQGSEGDVEVAMGKDDTVSVDGD